MRFINSHKCHMLHTFLRCPFVLRLPPAVKLAKLYSAVAFAEAAAPVVSVGFYCFHRASL